LPKQASKKERGFRGKEFLPARLPREAGQKILEVRVRIFPKKGSNFNQKRQLVQKIAIQAIFCSTGVEKEFRHICA